MTSTSRLWNLARRWYFTTRGIRIHPSCALAGRLQLRRGVANGAAGSVELGPDCALETGAILDAFGGSIVLGHRVFVGPYAVIYGHGGVTVGDSTLISMHCRILSSEHSIPYAGQQIRDLPDVLHPTRIGKDVWLGAGVTILGGVTIGDGCVVGAGAVVTQDLAPHSIAAGVPAKVFRRRETLG